MIFSALSYFAIVLYLLASIFQMRKFSAERKTNSPVKFLASGAIFCHFLIVFQTIFDGSAYNFGIYSMLSLMALTIGVIVLLGSFRRPISNLFLLIFPIGAVAVLLNTFFKNHSELKNEIDGDMAVHIAMSVIAYSILTIAAIQAAMLTFNDRMLRNRQLSLIKSLPALETMEQMMFELLWIGLLFLTFSIASGFLFVEDFSGPGVIHHTVLAIAAWLVFTLLALGRKYLGWRGLIASRWTVVGFVLLALGYFGSKFVMELLLN